MSYFKSLTNLIKPLLLLWHRSESAQIKSSSFQLPFEAQIPHTNSFRPALSPDYSNKCTDVLPLSLYHRKAQRSLSSPRERNSLTFLTLSSPYLNSLPRTFPPLWLSQLIILAQFTDKILKFIPFRCSFGTYSLSLDLIHDTSTFCRAEILETVIKGLIQLSPQDLESPFTLVVAPSRKFPALSIFQILENSFEPKYNFNQIESSHSLGGFLSNLIRKFYNINFKNYLMNPQSQPTIQEATPQGRVTLSKVSTPVREISSTKTLHRPPNLEGGSTIRLTKSGKPDKRCKRKLQDITNPQGTHIHSDG